MSKLNQSEIFKWNEAKYFVKVKSGFLRGLQSRALTFTYLLNYCRLGKRKGIRHVKGTVLSFQKFSFKGHALTGRVSEWVERYALLHT